jgi:DNA-directed RNA polymerase subunit delta
MKRVIKDFKSISSDVMALINDQYPHGYEDNELVTFVNAKGEFVKALEVRTDEVVYLIKLDRKLDEHINDYMDSDDDGFDSDADSVDVELGDADADDDDDL